MTGASNGGLFVYDANGNMTSRRIKSGDPTYTQTWDYENRLTQVTKTGLTATHVYDGDENRVKSTVNGVTAAYVGNYFEWTGSTGTMKDPHACAPNPHRNLTLLSRYAMIAA